MDINSSNYFSVSASTNKGMSGLISGMDTESMVEQMLSGTQSKITKQEQLKTQTEWKQEMYRDVIDTVTSFRNKYFDSAFDSTSKTNFAKSALFDTMTSEVTSGSAVRVISTGNASVGETRIAVKNLATASKMTGRHKLSGEQKLAGTALNNADLQTNFDKKVALRVNGSYVEVNLNGAKTEKEIAAAFNQAFADNGISGVSAKTYDGTLRFVLDLPSGRVEVDENSSSTLGLQMTGLSNLSSGIVTDTAGNATGAMFQSGLMDADAGLSFDLTLDGVTKNIKMTEFAGSDGRVTAQSVTEALDAQIKKVFGDYVKVELTGEGGIQLSANTPDEEGHQITVTGSELSKLGIEPGASTLLSMGSKLSDLGLTGDRFRFTINGVEFSFNGNDTIGNVINKVNSGKAGVRLSYSSLTDLFTMEATSSGAKYGLSVTQTEGDLLSRLFGSDVIEAGSSAASRSLTTGSIQGRALANDYETDAVSMNMTVNGKDYKFTLARQTGMTYTKQNIERQLNTWLQVNFGTDSAGRANISYADGKLNIADGYCVSFAETETDVENGATMAEAVKSDLALALGFSIGGKSNAATADTRISDILQLRGAAVLDADGNAAQTLAEIDTINGQKVSYASEGRLSMQGTADMALTDDVLKDIFGAEELKLANGSPAAGAVVAGVDAKVIINGVETSRNSNTFTIDGLTVQLTKVSAYDSETDSYEETVINTERDTDTIVEAFRGFVEDYNAMAVKLYDLLHEDANYREYAPLTSEQKKEMSEREIELWEEKAKEGLLRNDSTIESMVSAVRGALYTKPKNNAYALYDIGVDFASYLATDGKKGVLTFNETALRNALAADPDAVKNLFVDASEGLAGKIMSAIDSAAKTTGATKGTLVELAGVQGTSSEKSNTLYRQLQSISTRIKELQAKYERERQRYWNQFNAMESAMSNYNAQSNMLASYFSY